MSELADLFRSEAAEYLQMLNDGLLKLERGAAGGEMREQLDEMFRAAHSLKGMSATMGYGALTELTHRLEDLLDAVRNGQLQFGPYVADVLFEGLDALEAMLANPQEAVADPALIERLVKLLESSPSEGAAASAGAGSSQPRPEGTAGGSAVALDGGVDEETGGAGWTFVVYLAGDAPMKSVRAYTIVRELRKHDQILACEPDPETEPDEAFAEGFRLRIASQRLPEEIAHAIENMPDVAGVEWHAVAPATVEPAAPQPARAAAKSPAHPPREQEGAAPSVAAAAADRVVRVDTEQLDSLMNLVGELVIYKTRLEELSSELGDRSSALSETVEHIDRITDSLQAVVMALRMVPVRQVFSRFPRVVRDISRRMNKQVELIMEGEETELDRSIVYRIGDPLVHLIRNAVDHGIEDPATRKAQGKPEVGRLRLAARHEGNHVVIEVSDDGRGIDLEKVGRIAVERGVVTQAEWDALPTAERYKIIFRPGFSTAEQVTDVSGRGVGMDAVRNVVDSLNGQVEVHSEPGRGTRVLLRLPLTLAIIPALLVRCQREVYALPLEYVVQNLRLERDEVYTIQRHPHIRWRDEVLPLRSLAQLLGLPAASGNGHADGQGPAEAGNGTYPAVVVDIGPRRSALAVDEILGQQEIVIKSIGFLSGKVRGIAGATVLGNGRAALIADLPALI